MLEYREPTNPIRPHLHEKEKSDQRGQTGARTQGDRLMTLKADLGGRSASDARSTKDSPAEAGRQAGADPCAADITPRIYTPYVYTSPQMPSLRWGLRRPNHPTPHIYTPYVYTSPQMPSLWCRARTPKSPHPPYT